MPTRWAASQWHFARHALSLEAAHKSHGQAGLINSKPCPQSQNPKLRIPAEVGQKIFYIRREFGLAQPASINTPCKPLFSMPWQFAAKDVSFSTDKYVSSHRECEIFGPQLDHQ